MVTLLAYTVLEWFFNLVRQIYREHLFVIVSIPDKTATATELTIGSSGKVAIISGEKEQSCHEEETVIKNTGGISAVAASKSTSKDQVTRSCQTEAVACTETQVSPFTVP